MMAIGNIEGIHGVECPCDTVYPPTVSDNPETVADSVIGNQINIRLRPGNLIEKAVNLQAAMGKQAIPVRFAH